MKIVQTSDYMVYFDDVRVDPYIINWETRLGLYSSDAAASVTMFRTDAMDEWKAYLTQVRIFSRNVFSGKYVMVFEGEIMSRNWSQNRSNMGTVTFSIKGYYHWLDIPIPMRISTEESLNAIDRFKYEAHNMDIAEIQTLMTSRADVLMKDKTIEEIVKFLFEKLNSGYYDVAAENSSFGWADVENRFKVMADIITEFREAGFMDLFTFVRATQISTFFVYLNEVLTQLMLEFYQDRDGTFKIKSPSWNDPILRNHIIDSSIVSNISGLDDWQAEPTRVLVVGGESEVMKIANQAGGASGFNALNTVPIGLYIGDPRNPETEEYYSQQLQLMLQQYGSEGANVGDGSGTSGMDGVISTGEWYDNLTGQRTITSGHRTVNAGRPGHNGTDYRYKHEDLFNVGTNGKVIKVKFGSPTAGNYVEIQQQIGSKSYVWRYLHMSKIDVKQGQEVKPGQKIGVSGATGQVEGAHLHLEVWVDGGYMVGKDINPDEFLKQQKKLRDAATDSGGGVAGNANSGAPYAGGGMANLNGTGTVGATEKGHQVVATAPTAWQTYNTSAYDPFCGAIGKYAACQGVVATGMDVSDISKEYAVVAVDPKKIPLRSIVEIEGMGYYNALDTGGMIKGNTLDILMATDAICRKFGRKNLRARIIRRGDPQKQGRWIPGKKFTQSIGDQATAGAGYSSPYANVDGFSSMPPNLKRIYNDEVKKELQTIAKGVSFPSSNLVYDVPSYSSEFEKLITSKPNGVDANLLASIIGATSGWREKYRTNTHEGLMPIENKYNQVVLGDIDVSQGDVAISHGTKFLSECLSRFNKKATFALAAYWLGNMKPVQDVTEAIKSLDFVKAREKLPSDAVSFVDNVIEIYSELFSGNYINGDPHKDFSGKKNGDKAKPDDAKLPDYETFYKPNLSEEEKQYKLNLMTFEQSLIRNDSPALAGGGSSAADKLVYQYAKYMMHINRAKAHNIQVNLSTCMPFLRVGFNVWLEPTKTDLVAYITGLTHQGSYGNGSFTSFTAGYVRDPKNYDDIDTSIFIGETRATSEAFGPTVKKDGFNAVRNELSALDDKNVVDGATNISVLSNLYKGDGSDEDQIYSTDWNREYTASELDKKIKDMYSSAPSLIKKRKEATKNAITKSENIFLSKLLYTKK